MPPGQRWMLHEPGRLTFSWREQPCVHRVTCSGKFCKRKAFWYFLQEAPEKFQAAQILAPPLLGGVGVGWIILEGKEQGEVGGGSLKMTSMCEGSCEPDLPTPTCQPSGKGPKGPQPNCHAE